MYSEYIKIILIRIILTTDLLTHFRYFFKEYLTHVYVLCPFWGNSSRFSYTSRTHVLFIFRMAKIKLL